MYPPASNTIKNQTLQHRGTKVFYPSTNLDNRNFSRKNATGTRAPIIQQESKVFRQSNRTDENYDVWRTRSTGSTGSSPGTSTSPSVCTPISRDSSIGSASHEDVSSLTGFASLTLRPELNVKPATASMKPTHTTMKTKNVQDSGKMNNQQTRQTKNSGKPFNHKEVMEFMTRAFNEAKKAIEQGHGKCYDSKEGNVNLPPFEPFNWEVFWQQRKMNEL